MYLSDRVCYISPSFSFSLFSKFLIISQAGGGGKEEKCKCEEGELSLLSANVFS